MIRGSLYAGTVRSERERQIWREETAPLQVMLDLHLEGDGVTDRATSASRLGAFIQRFSEATKETAKHLAGRASYSEKLLIEGVESGSVRVVLRVPDPPEDPRKPTHDGVPAETVDSVALRMLAGVLTLASTAADDGDADEDPLPAVILKLPVPARERLRGAAQQVTASGWEIHGRVMQRRQPEATVVVTPSGAERLQSALKFAPAEPDRVWVHGQLDGFKRSEGVAYFIPDESRRGYAVGVVDAALFHKVARLAEDPERSVRAHVETYTATNPDGSAGRTSRILLDVQPSVTRQGTLAI